MSLLATVSLPDFAVGIALIVAAGFAYRARGGHIPATNIELVVVTEQLARAQAAPPADVLILGDSSALMGIDPLVLGAKMGGARVESLATLGFVGPAGYGEILRTYARGTKTIDTLILGVNGSQLDFAETMYVSQGFEQRVLGTDAPSLLVAGRREIYGDLVCRFLDIPMPGTFGKAYGSLGDLAAALRAGHGSIVDPNVYVAPHPPVMFRYRLSDPVASRLPRLRAAIEAVHPRSTFFVLTPLPDAVMDRESLRTREALAAKFLDALGLPPSALLETPPQLPDSMFATQIHLAAAGRDAYTTAVAAALNSAAVSRREAAAPSRGSVAAPAP